MNADELRRRFGDQYPRAVLHDGILMPLKKERRFSRDYHSDEHKSGIIVSRFMDGSASMALLQLKNEWSNWSEKDRLDFAWSCSWLSQQPDYPDMLRFVMEHGGPDEWGGIALLVAARLPVDEAFEMILKALRSSNNYRTANLIQAIAHTRHLQAEGILREHLRNIWKSPDLWEPADFYNEPAHEAMLTISYLIKLGVSPTDFEEEVRLLSEHTCENNRNSCRDSLSKYYPELG